VIPRAAVSLTLQRHVDISHIPTARSCDQLPNLIGGSSSLHRGGQICGGKEDRREKGTNECMSNYDQRRGREAETYAERLNFEARYKG
jgi:hypothetical protein